MKFTSYLWPVGTLLGSERLGCTHNVPGRCSSVCGLTVVLSHQGLPGPHYCMLRSFLLCPSVFHCHPATHTSKAHLSYGTPYGKGPKNGVFLILSGVLISLVTQSPNAMSGRPVGCDVVVTECCTAWYWPSAVMLPPSVALPGPPWHSVSKLIGDLMHRQNQVTIGLGQQALKTLAL